MKSPQAKRSAAGLAVAIGLSLVGFHDALAQSESLAPEHVKELYFDAARAGRVDLLDGMIKAGVNPNERDPHGFTPLILAAYNEQPQAVDFLIAKGADPCATDPKGNTALMGVAFKGDSKIADRLLTEHCDVNATNNVGQTALMMAALFGRNEVVKLLIAHGANSALKDSAGNTRRAWHGNNAIPRW
jgi:ankyrin repeat protein